LFKQIRSEVSRLCAENRLPPLLIIDEAHHLRTDLLEDLRLLTNTPWTPRIGSRSCWSVIRNCGAA
jgi:type II secretory pathway predicted ATPase ExeA